MKKIILILAFLSLTAQANVKDFVHIGGNRELYVDYTAPKKAQPTLVILNGLTYRTDNWDAFVKHLSKTGFGILRYDMWGQGKTLERSGPATEVIPYEEQVKDLKKLLHVLKIRNPVHLVGLSYGGGLAVAFGKTYPGSVASLILMAPFTEPLKGQDQWIRFQVASARVANPYNPASDDELYDYFLRIFVYQNYPMAEADIWRSPLNFEAVFRMVQGIRKYKANDFVAELPKNSMHLVVANEDQYIPRATMDHFWQDTPKANRASRIIISSPEHKIPESSPSFAAGWVQLILENKIDGGLTFKGDPQTGTAKAGSFIIELPKN